MAKKKNLKLTTDFDVSIIGIVSALPLYKIIHYINEKTFLRFICEEELGVYYPQTDDIIPFPFYYYTSEELYTDFSFVANNSQSLKLFASHKIFSAFIFVQGGLTDKQLKNIVSSIHAIEGIQIASLIKQSDIKELNAVLEDLEMHLLSLKKQRKEDAHKIMPLPENQ